MYTMHRIARRLLLFIVVATGVVDCRSVSLRSNALGVNNTTILPHLTFVEQKLVKLLLVTNGCHFYWPSLGTDQ